MTALAHDLKTPLGAAVSLAELTLAHAQEPEAVRGYARRMLAACARMQEIASALLGRQSGAPCVCTPVQLAREAAELFGERIALHAAGVCGVPVRADAAAVRRILQNLLENAVKYTPLPGAVRLAVDARREDDGLLVRYAVTDEGVGMGKETLSRLFQPYARGAEAVSAGIPGTGVWLCAAQGLAHALGGSITVESRLGAGSEFRFTVRLPVVREDALAGKRILIAEDHPLAGEALAEVLAEHGAQADLAGSGEEAMAAFAQSGADAYAAVLLDIGLPGMDGCETALAIRRLLREDARRVPVFALTGDDSPDTRERVRRSGMNGLLSKPLTMARLAAAMGDASVSPDGDASGEPA